METVLILLAAGASTRMGQSKQLLTIDHKTLLRKTTLTAIDSNIGPVLIVLGANESAHKNELAGLPATILSHPQWESGMGSSLKAGLRHALALFPRLENIIILVCDQPLLTAAHLKNLMLKKQSNNTDLVASRYDGTSGVPAIFNKKLFKEILNLPDDQGARKIIQQNISSADIVEFPEGAIDLDTPQDYDRFLEREK